MTGGPRTVNVRVPSAQTTFRHARIADGPAPEMSNTQKDAEGRQMALAVSTMEVEGVPTVAVALILGDSQITLALDPEEMDSFCHLLADATQDQTARLSPERGKAVH